MVLKSFQNDALNGLCSKDQSELLDSVDCLRSQGISHYVSLLQIIVCGDQSSGKSSVLEAISGVLFPIKSSLCTRFPTELILRKTSKIGVSVSIVPHQSCSEPERLSLTGFEEKLDSFDELLNLIDKAKAAMAISTFNRAFSKDLLRIEVSGPDRPHLTIVDLPGLIHSETKQQSASDIELVQDVVQLYMEEPRSIILAVVSAKNDYANQIVLKLARTADRAGTRTLGVITKPDTLIPDSESEAMYVSLARNQDVEFRLGWHVLRNMDSETGKWERLSKVLLAQVAAELPSLVDEIKKKTDACRSRLHRLGEPRATLEEQQLYLLHMTINGTYNDPFFENARSDTGYYKRVRAVIQNLNQVFAEDIARRGHRYEIINSPPTTPNSGVTTRAKFIENIGHLMRRSRGRELPGTFNPIIDAAKEFLSLLVSHVADDLSSRILFQKAFEPQLGHLLEVLKGKTAEFLAPHQTSHPITYNHYFTETIQNVRRERTEAEYRAILTDFFGTSSLLSATTGRLMDLRPLLKALMQRTEPDMNHYACSEALDCMEAYYKVAIKRFIDDIAIEVIEVNMISRLRDIFSPIEVTSMTAETVASIAGESEENRAQREQLTKQLDVLMKGSETCKRFMTVGVLDANKARLNTARSYSSESDDGSGDPVDCLSNSPSFSIRSPSVLSQEPVEIGETADEPLYLEDPVPEPELMKDEVSSLKAYSLRKKKKKSKVAEEKETVAQAQDPYSEE
ncbi:uncharacterized protein BDZ99DRAFT_491056 [Mytilinidion resinicola]|uniref:Dynamin family protein n=1 Tax=Mytilinidion resinicola TaxID=574789 RepID=A0A6A6Y7M5_9PEZI|nr:uncharacterized protein BDZ99DRAFT_491056 [Mytilinidion resinicola]KAF2804533.1 hypothetical protein BDZ99DRAFT_491056 [Mytilinidion resinicola]